MKLNQIRTPRYILTALLLETSKLLSMNLTMIRRILPLCGLLLLAMLPGQTNAQGCPTPSFSAASNFSVGNSARSVTTGDFNADGKLDLATANDGSNNVSVLLGDGLGGFGAATSFFAGSGPFSVTTGDFNADGKLDLATANFRSDNVSVLLNTCPSNNAPITMCQNITVSAGPDCTATITAAQVNNGSSDPDAGDSITLALDSTGPFGIGQHTVTLTATDSHSASNSCMATVTVVDATKPTLSCPANVVAYLPTASPDTGVVVDYPAPTVSDCSDVTITTSPDSGSVFPVGTTTVSVTATDAAGNQSTCSFTVTVLYNFIGFLQPVDNQPMVNVVSAGSAVPVRFSLNGNKGLAIMAAGYPASQAMACNGGVQEVIEETVTAGASSLSYDATTDTYTYVWKTDRAWRGTCRQLSVKLNDGTTHTANFQFR